MTYALDAMGLMRPMRKAAMVGMHFDAMHLPTSQPHSHSMAEFMQKSCEKL
jgi:hypothetical protein